VHLVVIDFESEFGDDYTLSKMSTEEYVRDSRFKAHGAGIKWDVNTRAVWYDERELRWQLANYDWSDVFLVAHHMHFDGLILTHHYNVHPKMWGCTLSCARQLLGNHIGVSLDSVRAQFGIPAKSTPYQYFRNKKWNELTREVQSLLAEGCCDEVESIWKIFGLMSQAFPPEEYDCIDSTIRMFVDPCLRADVDMLARVWEREVTRKAERNALLSVTPKQLGSNETFAAMLREYGVEPEMKDGKNGPIYAFAKTDPFMEALLADEIPEVRALAEARLEVKSTLLQTRAETLGWMANRGSMCVYLRFCGAHTSRWSGGDGCLTSDTMVWVFDWQKGLTDKRIVDILPDDLVWDGEEFVEHDGVVFRGYQEVIEHDSVRGTRDHRVFDDSGKEISLEKAAGSGTRLMGCKKPGRREVEALRKNNNR
jgi:DNA polymerase